MIKETMHRHFINFDIAGFSYWDGALVLEELKPGMRLEMVREEENKFDAYAVALYYGEHKLGFVPRTDNHDLSKFLEMGYGDIFEVVINRVSPTEHPEHQVGVIIYLKRRKEVKA